MIPDRLVPEPPPACQCAPDRPRDGPASALLDPDGSEAKDGAFVSTPAEEIYAILSVESHRQSAWLVGEDLGTVPPEVEGAMKQHGVRGMYVIQYEIRADEDRPLREVPEATVAGVNTHDMPPFASFWAGLDLDDRKDLGLLDGEALERSGRSEVTSDGP